MWEIHACEQWQNHLMLQELKVTSVVLDMFYKKCRLFRSTHTSDLPFLLSIKSKRIALWNFTNVPLNSTAEFLQFLIWLSGNPNNLALGIISALFTDFTLSKISKQCRSNVHYGRGLKSCVEDSSTNTLY